MGKVHGSLARAGKVKGQCPKVEKQEKKKKATGRAKKRIQYNRRFVNAVASFGGKRKNIDGASLRQSSFRESTNNLSAARQSDVLLGPEYDEFASVAIESAARGIDWFVEDGQLDKFYQVAKEKADSLAQVKITDPAFFSTQMATELHWWTMEANTWKLIRCLIRLRLQLGNTAPPGLGEDPEEMSDQEIQTNLVDAQFRENMTVRRWLEETAPVFQPVETRKGYWLHTVKHISASNFNRVASKSDIVTEADPDATLRQHKSLHPDDADYDANMHRTAFEYMRRGDLVAAADLYDACDQPWRAASLRGGVLSNDPDIDEPSDKIGNHNRDLWKAVCQQIASNDRVDPYERAIYAIAIGDAEHAKPVCKLWEDQVWMYYCALIEAQVDRNLRSVPLLVEPDEELEIDLRITAVEPAGIFEELEKSDSPYLKHAAHESFHVAQKSIVMNDIGAFLTAVKNQLQAKQGSDPSKPSFNPHFLRFVTHFVLILKELPIEIPFDDANFIIEEYVKLLTTARKNTLIAFYCSHLPSRIQLECYARFLEAAIEDPDFQQYVAYAKHYGLNYSAIAKRTIQLIFHGPGGILKTSVNDLNPRDILIAQSSDGVTQAEKHQITALSLLLVEKELYDDALWFANLLLRRFLLLGRVNAAAAVRQYLHTFFDSEKYLNQMAKPMWLNAIFEEGAHIHEDPEMSEALLHHMHILLLLQTMKLQSEWLAHWYRRPSASSGNLDGSESYEYREWAYNLKIVTKSAVESLEDVLDRNWMQRPLFERPEDDDDDFEVECALMRQIYIPQMVTYLHQIYCETGNKEKAAALAERVESDECLRDPFEKIDKLDAFLDIVRQSAQNLE
ncbi:hypothetical protein HDU87_004185 [Geranomyces variabilis]|uniref:Nuclear pore complex protein n=1 Tax=Geranomyces variabilis TaxID=109894 RepID=A0AAD5XS56_9FUNG|nr:hypothetical protein HDU87_004185 [Geranomyces variabilis]